RIPTISNPTSFTSRPRPSLCSPADPVLLASAHRSRRSRQSSLQCLACPTGASGQSPGRLHRHAMAKCPLRSPALSSRQSLRLRARRKICGLPLRPDFLLEPLRPHENRLLAIPLAAFSGHCHALLRLHLPSGFPELLFVSRAGLRWPVPRLASPQEWPACRCPPLSAHSASTSPWLLAVPRCWRVPSALAETSRLRKTPSARGRDCRVLRCALVHRPPPRLRSRLARSSPLANDWRRSVPCI